MGSLSLPASRGIFASSLYVDTQVLIYSVERHPVYGPLLQPLWAAARVGTSFEVVSSELALMETLVLPIRRGDSTLQADYESFLLQSDTRLIEIDQSVLREAARLRATIPGLRTPDAIHASTARHGPCSMFLTNDRGFRRIPGLPVTVLDDVLAAP